MKHSKKTFKFLTLRAQITVIVEKNLEFLGKV